MISCRIFRIWNIWDIKSGSTDTRKIAFCSFKICEAVNLNAVYRRVLEVTKFVQRITNVLIDFKDTSSLTSSVCFKCCKFVTIQLVKIL